MNEPVPQVLEEIVALVACRRQATARVDVHFPVAPLLNVVHLFSGADAHRCSEPFFFDPVCFETSVNANAQHRPQHKQRGWEVWDVP